MGLCCCKDDLECEHCGVPRSYYTNNLHAARKSCRRHSDDNSINMGYHSWMPTSYTTTIHWIKYLKIKQRDNMVQGYVLEEEVRLPEWSKGSR